MFIDRFVVAFFLRLNIKTDYLLDDETSLYIDRHEYDMFDWIFGKQVVQWRHDSQLFSMNPWRHQVVWTKIKIKINNWIRWRPTMYCTYKQTVNEEVKNMFAQIAVFQYGRYISAN